MVAGCMPGWNGWIVVPGLFPQPCVTCTTGGLQDNSSFWEDSPPSSSSDEFELELEQPPQVETINNLIIININNTPNTVW